MIEVKYEPKDKQFPVRIIFNNKTHNLTIAAARELIKKLKDIECQYT